MELLFDNRERKVNTTWNYYPGNDFGNISFIYALLKPPFAYFMKTYTRYRPKTSFTSTYATLNRSFFEKLDKGINWIKAEIELCNESLLMTGFFNLCNPFNSDLRCASLCGVDFVFKKERREKRAQWRSYLKGFQRLYLRCDSLTSNL